MEVHLSTKTIVLYDSNLIHDKHIRLLDLCNYTIIFKNTLITADIINTTIQCKEVKILDCMVPNEEVYEYFQCGRLVIQNYPIYNIDKIEELDCILCDLYIPESLR